MFERVLEKLLRRFLAPYVEGLSNTALRYGVRSGILELRDLQVKPEALSLLGLPGYSVKSGTIGSVSLHVSWKSLFTGGLYIAIDGLYLEAHEEAIPPGDMRVLKSKTVDLRMDQIRDMMHHSTAFEAGDWNQEGFLMRMNRKVLNNLSINISDVAVWVVTTSCPQAAGVKLPGLTVMSTDETFDEKTEKGDSTPSPLSARGGTSSLHKLLRLDGFCFCLSQAGSSSIDSATHVLSPLSACIRLTHAPREKLLQLHVELGSGKQNQNQITLRHSQWVHFFKWLAEAAEQALKMQAELVAPEIQRALLMDVEASAAEYGRLYEQDLVAVHACGPLLNVEDVARMQMLEDALPVRPLAQQRWLGHCSLKRIRMEKPAAVKKKQLSWVEQLGCAFYDHCRNSYGFTGVDDDAGAEEDEDDTEWLKEDVRHRLKHELIAVTKAEEVEPPARSRFHFVFRELTMELIDDRWVSEEAQELLTLVLPTALMSIDLDTVADSQGNEVTEWGVFCDFGAWQARHARREVLMHLLEQCPVPRKRSEMHLSRQESEDVPNAAKLAVESRLDSDSSILKVTFDSTPFEILLLPGMIGRIIEFFTTNGAEEVVQAAIDEHDQAANEFLLEGLDLYHKVQDQIPDRLFLDLSIAAPILRAPVEGRGYLVLCPGQLQLTMPEPCGYSRLEFLIVLSDTVLSAVTESGENFNMIQPVPVKVGVISEDTFTQVDVAAESLALFLAPEALEMLLYLPETVNDILDEGILPTQEDEYLENDARVSEGQARPPSVKRHQTGTVGPSTSETRSLFRGQARLLEGAPNLMLDLGIEDAFLHTPSGEGFAGRGSKAGYKRHSSKVARLEEDFKVTTTVCCDRLTLLLADVLTSMLRLQLELPTPGLSITTQRLPEVLTVDVERSSLELEGLNQHHGQWEPVIEVFSFGLAVRQPPDGAVQPAGSAAQSIGVELTGLTPLLLNLTPTLFEKVNRSIELVTQSVTAASASPGEGRKAVKTGAKYRLFNLCGCPFEIQFYTGYKVAESHTVVPTGSAWESMDRFILPCFATEVTVRLLDSSQCSRRLQLELDGVAVVPGDRAILEIFTPAGDKHRVLLLAPPLRLLNMTETPLHLRFHGGSDESDSLPIDLEHTMECKASLLGGAPDEGGDGMGKEASLRTPGILHPKRIFAVPEGAVRDDSKSHDSGLHCWLSVGTTGTEHSKPVKVGGEVHPHDVFHYQWDQCVEAAEDVYIEWKASLGSLGHSARSTVATVELRPPVMILNAVPIGVLMVRYQQSSGRLSNKWFEVTVPQFRGMSLHNVARVAPGDSLFMSARLSENAPWSSNVRFTWDQLQGHEAQQRTVQVHQQKRGAAVGLTIEPVDGYKLRFSCPFWFVNCSGIEPPFSLEVHQGKRQLPSEDGLALLPSLCQQEPVDLVLRKEGSVAATLEKQYMPPNWSTLSWAAGGAKRPLVFCVQVETIDPVDVFGAECQAMVLRPRLVFTNYSKDDIELLILGRQVELAAGQSIEYHWPVSVGTDEPPSLELRFRPRSTQPQRQWSSTVVCSDVSAGSTPFMLRAAREADGDGVEVWSVEVAPMRGALAVSFKQGSNFIALHNAPLHRRRRSHAHSHIYHVQSHIHHAGSNTVSVHGGPKQSLAGLGANSTSSNSFTGNNHNNPDMPEMLVRPCSSEGTSTMGARFKRTTVVTPQVPPGLPVVPGVEVPFGWAEPFVGSQQRSVEVLVNTQTYHIEDVRQTTVVPVENSNLVIRVARQGERTLLMLEVDRRGTVGDTGGLTLHIQLCQVGISFIDEAPTLRELLYVHFEPLLFDYRDTDSDAHELGLRIETAQMDCQLPGRREETSPLGRLSRMGKAVRSSDVWRPAVVLRNLGRMGQPFLALNLQRSATSSGDIVLPKVDLALDKLEVHMDDDWLEALKHWCRALHAKGLDQVVKFMDVVIMAGRPITEGYKPPPLPSVVQVESLSISDVKLTIWCRLRLHSLSFLPQYVLTGVKAVSLSNFFTLNGASVSLKRRTFPAHRGSLEDFLAALGAEYGRSVVANIFSILHSSSLLNLPRAPLKIGQGAMTGAMTGVSKGLRHMAENAPITPPFVSPRSVETSGSHKHERKAVVAKHADKGPFQKMLSRMNSFTGEGKQRIRRRQPRLLLPAVGELRPWSPLDAAILAQLGRVVCKDLHEVVPLTPAPPASRWCTVLLLCSEMCLIACIDSGLLSDSRWSLQSSNSSTEEVGQSFFDRLAADTFYTLSEVEQGGIDRLRSSVKVMMTPTDADLQRKVRGIRFSSIRTVLRQSEESGPILELLDVTGRTHKLPLPSAQVSESVRDAIAEGLQSAVTDCDGDANWTVLRTTLYADRRGLKAGRPQDAHRREVTIICL